MVQSSYIHAMRGRLRINVSCLKRNQTRATTLEHHLRGVEGVRHVTANPMTGNVLIEYDDARLKHTSVIDWLCDHGYVMPVYGWLGHTGSERQLSGLAQSLVASAIEAFVQRAFLALI